MNADEARALMNDPVAQELINSTIPMRLAYTALDGTPRVIPLGYHWTGEEFVFATNPTSRKVAAIEANPAVAITIDSDAMPPQVLLVRGTARIEQVEGLPDVFLTASAKRVPAEGMADFEANVRALYKKMAVISIRPTWATIHDFETRLPSDVEKLIREQQEGS